MTPSTTLNPPNLRPGLALLAVLYVLSVVFAGSALAQPPPRPEITVEGQTRGIELGLEAENSSDGTPVGETVVREALGNEPFLTFLENQFTGDGGASATGSVVHESRIATYVIEGQTEIELAFQGGSDGAQARADAVSSIGTSFTVAADAPFVLSGRLEATSSDPAVFAQVSVGFSGTRPDGSFFFIQEVVTQFDVEPVDFSYTEEVMGGSVLSLQVQAVGGGNSSNVPAGDAFAHFDFSLDFGDEDADGLLDVWETEGIDADGDGIVDIDLPSMGAQPRKKDLFVEVDALNGVPVDVNAFQMVKDAFAAAPADQVENPDGSTGVTLHVLLDETDLEFTAQGEDPGYLTGLGDIGQLKTDHFGTPADRNDPDWQNHVRPVRLKVFRYCVLSEGIRIQGTDITPFGMAEIPGNELAIAPPAIMTKIPHATTRGIAGTFMHELGHNLGLRHVGLGGANFKPNYLSVMNYTYAVPYEGTEDAFLLDFSRETLPDLDEAALDETGGLTGPADRNVMYNSAEAGQEVARSVVPASASQVDWNADGILESAVAQDINRIRNSRDASPDEVHSGATDWPRLWYHLSGDPAFDAGSFVTPEGIAEEISGEIVEEISASQVVDVGIPTGIGDDPPRATGGLRVHPNPFNPRVTVRFALAGPQSVDLDVYDLRGRHVRSLLADERLAAGRHGVTWDGRDDSGQAQASGTYLLRLRAGDRTESRKVLLVE